MSGPDLNTSGNSPASFLFVVPKKNFPNASDRNYIRRCMRESIRTQKQELYTYLMENNLRKAFGIVYLGKQKPTFEETNQQIKKLLTSYIQQS